MAFVFGSTSTNLANGENAVQLPGKNTMETGNVMKRPALGEISNTLDRFTIPSLRNAIKKNQLVKGSTLSKVDSKQLKLVRPDRRQVQRSGSTASLGFVPNEASINTETAPKGSFSSGNLQDIEDVDKGDLGNPLLVAQYAPDIYCYLLELETRFPVRPNFLAKQEIAPKMRSTLVDWLVDVQEQYKLLQETLFLAITTIDRYLQEVPTERKYLQLVGVAALFIAGKYEEIYPLDVGELVFVTDHAYNKREVLSMEKKILNTLHFDLGKPLSLHFLRRFSKVSKAVPLHHNFSKYFLEWALMDYELCHLRPSRLAAAALFISMSIHSREGKTSSEIWNKTQEHYSGVPLTEVQTVAVKMAEVILKAQQSKYQAIGRKYASAKMMKVSQRPELACEPLKKLAAGVLP